MQQRHNLQGQDTQQRRIQYCQFNESESPDPICHPTFRLIPFVSPAGISYEFPHRERPGEVGYNGRPLRDPFSVLLCPLPEVPLPALLADGFRLRFPGAEGAFADAGLTGKGGTAQPRPLAEGQNLPGLSHVQEAVVLVQQVGHRHAVQLCQPVYDGSGDVFAGAGLHVDVKGCGDAHPLGHLPLQQTHLEAAPPQPVRDVADLLITVVLPGKPLGFRKVGRWDEPEPVHGQGREAGLAVIGAAEYVEIRRDPSKDLPFWQRLANPFRCSSRNSQTGVFVRIAFSMQRLA